MTIVARQHETVAAPRHLLRLAFGTTVFTLQGALPVEYLAPGDRIITRAGARTLKAVETSVQEGAELVCFGRSTLAHDKPAEDMSLPADQNLLVRGSRARLVYGVDHVQVAAERLADGRMVRQERSGQARLCTLGFDEPVVIYAGQIEAATTPFKDISA